MGCLLTDIPLTPNVKRKIPNAAVISQEKVSHPRGLLVSEADEQTQQGG